MYHHLYYLQNTHTSTHFFHSQLFVLCVLVDRIFRDAHLKKEEKTKRMSSKSVHIYINSHEKRADFPTVPTHCWRYKQSIWTRHRKKGTNNQINSQWSHLIWGAQIPHRCSISAYMRTQNYSLLYKTEMTYTVSRLPIFYVNANRNNSRLDSSSFCCATVFIQIVKQPPGDGMCSDWVNVEIHLKFRRHKIIHFHLLSE